MKKIKKESKVETKEECQRCEHLENARDYFHQQYHKEQEKVKTLVDTVAMLSAELKDATETIKMLEEDN